jgi:hypothetical protein
MITSPTLVASAAGAIFLADAAGFWQGHFSEKYLVPGAV